MFGPLLNRIRAVVIAIVGALVGFGWLPPDAEQVIAENADAIIGGVLGLWAIVAYFRKGDKKEVSE